MSRADIVRDVEALIEKYGVQAVSHTIGFLNSFPTEPVMFRSNSGMMAPVNQRDYLRVKELADAGNKIQAIKLLREIVPGLGLKDSKEMVEAKFPYMPQTQPPYQS